MTLLTNEQYHTVLARSLWIGQSNTNPLNYPINLLEDDLCKTKVLKWLVDFMFERMDDQNGPYLRELACRNCLQALRGVFFVFFTFFFDSVTQEKESRWWDWLFVFCEDG